VEKVEKKKFEIDWQLLTMIFVNFLIQAAFGIIGPFLPFELRRKEID